MVSINQLHSEVGAVNYLVPDLWDLATIPLLPKVTTESVRQKVPDMIVLYNSELKTALDNFETTNPGVKVYRFQTTVWSSSLLSSKERLTELGITNTTGSCLNFDVVPPTACEDPESYFYVDPLHVTTKIHKDFAKNVLELLKT